MPQPQRATKSTQKSSLLFFYFLMSLSYFLSYFFLSFFPKQTGRRAGRRAQPHAVQYRPDNPAPQFLSTPGIFTTYPPVVMSTQQAKGGLKSSCQGARTVPLCKITPLTDTRHCICHLRRLAAAPSLCLGWCFGRGVGQGKNINEMAKMAS